MFKLIWDFVRRFALDPNFAAPRLRALFAALAGTSFLGSQELADAIGSPHAARWFKLAGLVLGVIAAAVKAGDRNKDVHELAEELQQAGYLVTPPPAQQQPPSAPPPAA